MSLFSRNDKPTAVTPCAAKTKCAAAKQEDDGLVAATADRIRKLTGRAPATNGVQPGDFGEQLRPANWTMCQNMAEDVSAKMRRFARYSAALPYAQAASDVNALGDKPDKESKGKPCLTRLTGSAADLNRILSSVSPGGKSPELTDEMLRNDKTGFRAAIYQSQPDGKLILVARDTERQSLVDWKTNTDNGQGLETDQYNAMRSLTGRLAKAGVPFDLAGYSKGGGLAQEGGLINPEAKVVVFNSAGIPDQISSAAGKLIRSKSDAALKDLASRTSAFSSEDDFLTYLNNTTDPKEQIANASYLRDQLAKSGNHDWQPIGLKYYSPETMNAKDADFKRKKEDYLSNLDQMIEADRKKLEADPSFRIFPPVRAATTETIPEPPGTKSRIFGAGDPGPSLGKLNQHRMEVVQQGMDNTIAEDRKAMNKFIKQCG